jgi:hypothetical protein
MFHEQEVREHTAAGFGKPSAMAVNAIRAVWKAAFVLPLW